MKFAKLAIYLLQRPILINYYANQIEEATKNLFVNTLKCGVTIKNKHKARKFVENCIDNPSLLNDYIENEKKLDKTKNGAYEIAKFVLEELV